MRIYKTIKQRYFDKIYKNAKMILCACGCRILIKNKDKYGRDRKYISGHNGRKYEDPLQYKREWNKRNKEQRTLYRKEARHRRKVELIIYKGGVCEICNLAYEEGENASVFDFHHLKNKIFNISGNVLEYSMKVLKKEADKCELLCANCHRLVESEAY